MELSEALELTAKDGKIRNVPITHNGIKMVLVVQLEPRLIKLLSDNERSRSKTKPVQIMLAKNAFGGPIQ